MKKGVLVLLLAIITLFSAFVSADVIASKTFFVKAEMINDRIPDPKTDSAEFNILVENKGDTEDTYKLLYLDDPRWSYQVLPGPLDKQITVGPGETGKIHILVKGNVADGLHSVKVSVQSLSTHNVIDNVMRIYVGSYRPPGEPPEPDFDVTVSVPSKMDPTGTYNVLVDIKNNNDRLLEDVNIKLVSSLISEDTEVTVEPNETKSISFAVILMDTVKPQEDQLNVKITYEDEVFYEGDHNFEVVEYLPPFRTEISVEKKFLRQDRAITITNDGNTVKSDSVMLETSMKERFFSWSKPKFTAKKEGGKYYFSWPVTLEAGESAEIKLTTSYRLLLLLALIIIALLVYRIATSNPLIVKKKFMSVHKEHGGAISNLSVVILLKNRSKMPITNLRVIERVSKMVSLKDDSFAGSMHPVKMHSRENAGTLLEYRFGELGPGDERIIKYKVYSKLHIFGLLTIKPTVVEFEKKGGIKKKARSRAISIGKDEDAPTPKPPKPAEHHRHE